MHLGIAPSLRLEIASNLGLPIVHVISSQALSDEQRSRRLEVPLNVGAWALTALSYFKSKYDSVVIHKSLYIRHPRESGDPGSFASGFPLKRAGMTFSMSRSVRDTRVH